VTRLEFHYSLQRIRSAQQDPELLAKALIVYHANTPQLEATSTNEILYWADHYDECDDELFIFALAINDVVIGYAQCVSFTEQSFVIIDYMTVDERHKTVGIFLLFFEQIKEFFLSIGLRYDFIVAEILQEADGAYTQSSDFWRTIMALERFRVVDAQYHQLQLGRTKFDTQVPARLMIGAGTDITTLRTETYLMIVETMLLRHYLRWYRPFHRDDEASAYEAKAHAIFEAIRASLSSKERVQLSPIPGIILPKGSFNGAYRSQKGLILFESLSYLLLLALLVGSTMVFRLNATEVLLLAVGALLVRMALLSIFVPEASTSLKASLAAFQALLGKHDSVASKRPKKSSRKK
jgi:hypothetical protein